MTDVNTTHSFLKNMESNEARAAAIAKLPEWRKKKIIDTAIPGMNVGGLTWSEAMSRSGADFEVSEHSLFVNVGVGDLPIAPNHKGVVRCDTNKIVGVVGSNYGVVQHHEALEGLREVCNAGHATLEALSVEDGGARISATALLGFSSVSQLGSDNGDALAHFMRAKNAHDGSGCYELSLFTLRLICFNGMTAMSKDYGVKLRHSAKISNRVAAANRAVDQLIVAAVEETEMLQRMAQDRITLKDFIEFASELLTATRGKADTEKKETRRLNDVTNLRELFSDGAGNHGASKYDAYNAVTDWIAVRRDQYKDAAKFAASFRNGETGTAARTRTQALRLLA